MKVKSSAIIQAEPEAIWPYLADPVRMSQWNEKLISVDRDREGNVAESERFRTLYQMKGKQKENETVVAELQFPHLLHYQHYPDAMRRDQVVDEIYHLGVVNGGTRVRQQIGLSSSGIPLWARLLIKLIHTFGKPVDRPYLERLRDLVEGRESTPPQ